MQALPPMEKTATDAAWLLQQFEAMQQSVQDASLSIVRVDEAGGPWAIANRVCDRYKIRKAGSVMQPAAQ